MSVLAGVSADHATNRYPFLNDHGTLFEPANDDDRRRARTPTRRRSKAGASRAWSSAKGRRSTSSPTRSRASRASRASRSCRRERRASARDRGLGAMTRARAARSRARATSSTRGPPSSSGARRTRTPLLELALYTQQLRIVGRRVEQSVGATLDVTDSLRIRPVATVAHEGIERDPDDIPLGHGPPRLRARRRRRGGAVLDAAEAPCPRQRRVSSHRRQPRRDLRRPRADGPHRRGARRRGALRVLVNVGRYVRVPTLGEVYGVSGDRPRQPGARARDGVHRRRWGPRADGPRAALRRRLRRRVRRSGAGRTGSSPTSAPGRGTSRRTTSAPRACSEPRS